MRTLLARRLLIVSAAVLTASPAFSQTADNVMVVINDDSPASQRVGEHYVRVRAIPAINIVRVRTATEESIQRPAYVRTIEDPIRAALQRERIQDRILYIVLTKGIPLRIEGTEGTDGTVASVDSELTLLYRRMTGRTVDVNGRVPNPYYVATISAFRDPKPFSRRQYDFYLVTRLDGFTIEDAIALIDRAQAPARTGNMVFDKRGGVLNNPAGDIWLSAANRRLNELGLGKRVISEETTAPAAPAADVLGYYSWGSNDPENPGRRTGMKFLPGAIAGTFAGADARTLDPPPPGWVPTGNWQDRPTFHAGAPTSLAGDLIREGATGVVGYVADPFLQSTARPELLFPGYVSGFNLAEAFYQSIPNLSWQAVVFGDPLCRPFPREPLKAADIEDPIDPETELPAIFATRRLDSLRVVSRKVPPKALSLLLVSENRLARDDRTAAIEALEQATELAPSFATAQLQLAMLYELEDKFIQARPRYEEILKVQPRNLIALNNLAYGLAVHLNLPEQAKPLAEKAVSISPRSPTVIDTLAWVEYLSGGYTRAAELIAQAVEGASENPDIRLHAAFIYAALKRNEAAASELAAARALNPTLLERKDVQDLAGRLAKPDGLLR